MNSEAMAHLRYRKTIRMWNALKHGIKQCMLEKEKVERLMEIKLLRNERLRVVYAFEHLRKGTRSQKADDLY